MRGGSSDPGGGMAEPATTSWFVGFAPAESPRLIVSVLLQNGAVWRRKAAEVARDLMRFYFLQRGATGITMPDALLEREATLEQE